MNAMPGPPASVSFPAVPMTPATAFEAGLTLPARSVARAVNECVPAGSAAGSVHRPAPFAGALPSGVGPSNTLTVEKASAAPKMEPAVSPIMPGAPGATVSSVTFNAAETAETLPNASVWVAVMALTPSANGVVGVTDQWLPPRTVPVPIGVTPSNKVMMSPGAPVPMITGAATLVIRSPLTALSLPGSRPSPAGAAG